MQNEPSLLLDLAQALWRLLSEGSQSPSLTISDLSQYRTELRIGSQRLVLDRRSRLITKQGSLFLRFDAILSIDVVHSRGHDERPDCWKVKLKTGPLWGRTLLSTTDDADASILAARISTITGKPVRSY